MLHDATADIFCIHTCIEINETVSSFLSSMIMFEGKATRFGLQHIIALGLGKR